MKYALALLLLAAPAGAQVFPQATNDAGLQKNLDYLYDLIHVLQQTTTTTTATTPTITAVMLSSVTNLATYNYTDTAFSVAVAGSTMNFTTGANPIMFGFSGNCYHGSANGQILLSALLDGSFLSGYNSTRPLPGGYLTLYAIGVNEPCGFGPILTSKLGAGAHTLTIVPRTSGGTATINGDANSGSHFWAVELKPTSP